MMKYLKEWSYKVGENSVDILVELSNNMTFYSVVIRQGLNEVVIDFDTNFYYNNTDNLIIAFDENTEGYSSSTDEFYCTISNSIRGMVYISNNNNPDPDSPPSANYMQNSFANARLMGITHNGIVLSPTSLKSIIQQDQISTKLLTITNSTVNNMTYSITDEMASRDFGGSKESSNGAFKISWHADGVFKLS